MLARIFLLIPALVFTSLPAEASDGAQVPEASSLTLFALGAAGVILGRRIARRGGKPRGGPSGETGDPSDKA